MDTPNVTNTQAEDFTRFHRQQIISGGIKDPYAFQIPSRFYTDKVDKNFYKSITSSPDIPSRFFMGCFSNTLHAPFDEECIDFFSSTITFSQTDSFVKSAINNALYTGYGLIYKAKGTTVVLDYDIEPVFNSEKNFIGFIDYDGDGNPILKTDRGSFQLENGEPVQIDDINLSDYILFSVNDGLAIWSRAIGLMRAYDSSLNRTDEYMRKLADAMLLINGMISKEAPDQITMEKIGKMYTMVTQATPDGNGNFAKPDIGYIHPEMDTTANEAHKDRLHTEIFEALALPDFTKITGNVSTDSMRIFMLKTIQQASKFANDLQPSINQYFGEEVGYKIEVPESQNDNMTALNGLNYLSDQTKIEQAFPDWNASRVQQELNRLAIAGQSSSQMTQVLSAISGNNTNTAGTKK